jgi:hypothetical protein
MNSVGRRASCVACIGRSLWSALMCMTWLVACASSPPPPPKVAEDPKPVTLGPRVSFQFEALDGTAVTTDTSAGRNTVLGFLTTYDLASQAQANFLRMVSRQHVPRTNVYAVVVERQDSRPLVQAFADSLGLRFPVIHIDSRQLAHTGFADVTSVPSIVILDKQGRRAWRKTGIVEAKEIDATLLTLE